MKARSMMLLLLALLLQGCFLSPGTFDSSLDLRRDGGFTYAYKGEIVFALPQDMVRGRAWSDDLAKCHDDGKADAEPSGDGISPPIVAMSPSRRCTSAEIAKQRKEWEANHAPPSGREAEESKKFAQLFGFTPGDDAANRKLAAEIARYDGFRSVTYAGNGVFNVDYAKSGRLDHDFVFPVLMQGNAMFPFVIARRQHDGAVRVAAPAFVGQGGLGMFEQLGKMGGGGAKTDLPPARTKGRFTLATDGEVLTNNTRDGPVAAGGGKRLVWDVDQRTTVAPEALVKLR